MCRPLSGYDIGVVCEATIFVDITGFLLYWFQHYHSDHKLQIVLHVQGPLSDHMNITTDTHQGLILGPLLFLAYINDIVKDINSTMYLFDYDTSVQWTRHRQTSNKLKKIYIKNIVRVTIGYL